MNLFLAAIMLAVAPVKADTDEIQAFKMLNNHKMVMVSTVEIEDNISKPYSSLVGIAIDKGQPFIFISDLAVHTDNIKANPYASVMAFEPAKDNLFDSPRVTFNGKFVVVKDEKVIKRLRKAYLANHKDAKDFIDFGDFNFYTLEIESIYFVGGFGDNAYIGYLDVKDYKKQVAKFLKND